MGSISHGLSSYAGHLLYLSILEVEMSPLRVLHSAYFSLDIGSFRTSTCFMAVTINFKHSFNLEALASVRALFLSSKGQRRIIANQTGLLS